MKIQKFMLSLLWVFGLLYSHQTALSSSLTKKKRNFPISRTDQSSLLLKRLETLELYQKTTVKQYRGGVYDHRRFPPSSEDSLTNPLFRGIHSIEEEEAIVMQYTLTYLLDVLDLSMNHFPRLIRICTDTLANTFSSIMIGFGGILNLFANTFALLSSKLAAAQVTYQLDLPSEEYLRLQRTYRQYYQNQTTLMMKKQQHYPYHQSFPSTANDSVNSSSSLATGASLPIPPLEEDLSITPPKKLPNYLLYRINKSLMKLNMINGLKNTANVLYGIREAFILTAEVSEAVTLGLGEALEDSFKGLQFLSVMGHHVVDYLLVQDDLSDQLYHEHRLLKHQNQYLHSSREENDEREVKRSNRDIRDLPTVVIPNSNSDPSVQEARSSQSQPAAEADQEESSVRPSLSSKRILIRPSNRTSSHSSNASSSYTSSRPRPNPSSSFPYNSFQEFFQSLHEMEVQLYYQSLEQCLHLLDQVSLLIDDLSQRGQAFLTIIQQSLEIPSISGHLIVAFLVILIVIGLPLEPKIRIPLVLMIMMVFWFVIIAMEYTQRYRLIQRIQVETLEHYFQEEIRQFTAFPSSSSSTSYLSTSPSSSSSLHPISSSSSPDSSHDESTISENEVSSSTSYYHVGSDRLSVLQQLRQQYLPVYAQLREEPQPTDTSHTSQRRYHHHLLWWNTLLTSLWNIMDHELDNQGLGLYLSEYYEELLIASLSSIYETTTGYIHDIKVKKFDLGVNPPLLKALTTNIIRDSQCIQQLLQENIFLQHTSDYSMKRKGFFTTSSTSSSSSSSSHRQAYEQKKKREELKQYFRSFNTSQYLSQQQQDFIIYLSDQFSEFFIDHLFRFHRPHSPTSTSSTTNTNTTSTTASSPESSQYQENSSNSSRNSSSSPPSASPTSDQLFKVNHYFTECDQLILDLDVIFVSKDMDIILSLRTNEIQSMLPEFSISISEMIFEGKMQMKIALTTDYPFFGNATLSFLELPVLDVSVTSFGGLDLSSIPYAYQIVNTSLYSVLQEYTQPNQYPMDLRHTICPTCDEVQRKTYSISEMWIESRQHFHHWMRQSWKKLRYIYQQSVQNVQSFLSRHWERLRELIYSSRSSHPRHSSQGVGVGGVGIRGRSRGKRRVFRNNQWIEEEMDPTE